MNAYGLILVPCSHSGGSNTQCQACHGSGWVAVVPGGDDGKPKACQHGGGSLRQCIACKGSGWAGLVQLNK